MVGCAYRKSNNILSGGEYCNRILDNNKLNQTTIYIPLKTEESTDAIVDSGTTTHCLCTDSPCKLEIQTRNGLKVTQPDGTKIQATAECEFDMENIPKNARKSHKCSMLARNSLISVRQLCDAGFEVTFYHDKVTVTKDSK